MVSVLHKMGSLYDLLQFPSFLKPDQLRSELSPAKELYFVMSNNFYEIVETAADGSEVNFKKFEGKVVYGVNVASEWVHWLTADTLP